jgi:IclR family pca regulon transcriptional regulator
MSASASTGSSASASATNGTFRSLEYGFGLLALFTPERPVWGIAELAAELNVSPSTVHRYTTTALNRGYLEQTDGRLYRPARRCAELGMAVLETLWPSGRARPILRELRRRTGRTVSLAVLDGDDVLYLQRLCGFQRGQYLLEQGLGAGSRLGISETAAGVALAQVLQEISSRKTPWSKRNELVVKDAARHTGALGLALGVNRAGEASGAIEITVPAASMDGAQLLEELGEPLRDAGAALEAALDAALDGEKAEERVA